MTVTCDHCGEHSYDRGGQPICCHCGKKINPPDSHDSDPLADLEFGGPAGERRWQELRREMDATPRGDGEVLGEDVPL